MNILYKRPLSLILCIALGSFVIFARSTEGVRLFLVLFALLLLSAALAHGLEKPKRIILLISGTAMLLSMLLSHLYFDRYFNAQGRFPCEISAVGELTEINIKNQSATLTVKTENIENAPFSSYKISLITDADTARTLMLGDKISFTGSLKTPGDSYSLSRGISARISEPASLEVAERRKSMPLYEYTAILRERFSRRVILLTDEDTGSLLSALLTGEREHLSDSVELDFKRIGITHILALSGMHLAILTLGLHKLLRLFFIGKRARTVISAMFALLYIVFTGFPITVVRAGIMLLISATFYILTRPRDSLSSLVMTVFFIIAITPYAVYDISLWLSGFATLGVIIAAEYESSRYCPPTVTARAMRAVSSGLLCSVFALSATLFITVIEFGALSLISPFSTPVFSLLAQVVMYLGCAMLLLGDIVPISRILIPTADLTLGLAAKVSDIDGIYISTHNPTVYIAVIIFTLLFYALVLIKLRRKRLAVRFIIVLFSAFFVLSFAVSVSPGCEESFVYSGESNRDLLLLHSNGESAVINSSLYSESSGYLAQDLAAANSILKLDKYYFTHYSYNIPTDIEAMLSAILVDEVCLPEPENEDEEAILRKIEAILKDYRTKTVIYRKCEELSVGSFGIFPIYCAPYGEASVNALALYRAGEQYLYLSSGALECAGRSRIEAMLPECDGVIFGSHGKKYSEELYFDSKYEGLSKMIFSGERLYLTEDGMQYYENNGCEIFSHPSSIDILD